MDEKIEPSKIECLLDKVVVNKSSGKITFEFPLRCLKEVHKIQTWNAEDETNFWLVVVPFNPEV